MKYYKKVLVLAMSLFLLTGCTIHGSGTNEQTPPNYDDEDTHQDPPVVEVNTVSYTVRELAGLYNWENNTPYQLFALDGAVDVATSNGKYVADSEEQYCLDSSSSITISVKGERELKSITVTYISLASGTLIDLPSGGAKDVSGKSVTFSVSDVGRVNITALSVSYIGEKGSTITPIEKEGWSKEELALIDEYIYGVEVPFVKFDNTRTYLNEGVDTLYIEIENATLADYNSYVYAFSNDSKYVCTEDVVPDNDATFVQEVEIEAGKRFVVAKICLIDEEGYIILDPEMTGTLFVELSDPYYYAWNDELIHNILVSLHSEAVVPVVDNVSYFEKYSSNDYSMFSLYFYEQDASSLNNYRAKFEGWTLLEEDVDAFTFVPASDDLELTIFYSLDEQILGLVFYKHLPQLNEYPAEAIREYLGGYEPQPISGATYYTLDVLDMTFELDEGDPIVIQLGLELWAYGMSETKFNEFLTAVRNDDNNSITKVTSEDDDGNEFVYYYVLVTRPFTDGLYYEYTFMYVEEENAIEVSYTPRGEYVYFYGDVDTWSQLKNALDYRFFTPKELNVNVIPELPLGDGHFYSYEVGMNDDYYIDCAKITVSGNQESAWVAILANAGFSVPETPDDEYGYECISGDGIIEIDIQYSSIANKTYASIYTVEDLAQLSDY